MEANATQWPPLPKSIFTDGSSEDTNQAFRDNPLLGSHKHGPCCEGHVRATVYPLTPEARICCEAEPKEPLELNDDTASATATPSRHIVRLRQCKESTYFSIGTSLTGNVTLKCPDKVDDNDTDWKNQIQLRIYPDPDGNDAELFNGSPSLTVSVLAAGSTKVYRIHPFQHLLVDARRSWAIKITKLHTFGLVLHSAQDSYNALVAQHVPRNKNRIFQLPITTADALENKAEVRWATPVQIDDPGETTHASRHIDLPALPESSLEAAVNSEAFDVQTLLDADSPPPAASDDDPHPVVLFQDSKTTVEEFIYQGKKRVRKSIRNISLHQASTQWEKETRFLGKLSHPHIIRAIEWNIADLSVDFEHGGKDIASLKNATNMFDVAVNLANVQERIWVHTTSALAYLHSEKRIKHCDIKPQNILLSDDHQTVKLCDFGHARDIHDRVRGGGTHCYIAPEFLLSNEISSASDIWALGITMLFVLNIIPLPGTECGAEVWQIHMLKDDQVERRKMRRWLRVVSRAVEKIPDKWSLLREMLDFNPRTRISARELVERLGEQMPMRKNEQQEQQQGLLVV